MLDNLSGFTNKYSLSKTLRFELIPQFETEVKLAETIKKQDEERSKYYPVMKLILDNWHKNYVEETLSGLTLSQDILAEAFSLHQSDGKDDKKKKQEKLNSLKKAITDCFKAKQVKTTPEEIIKQLQSNFKDKETLHSFAKELSLPSEEITKAIETFNKFSTYFEGYKENRNNIYTDKKGSISFRLIDENLTKFFFNIGVLQNIKDKYSDLYAQIQTEAEQIIHPADFNKFLTQKGINAYNNIIGASSQMENRKQGINEHINLYIQKHQLKRSAIPFLQQFYKQILSDREKDFIAQISDENDLKSEVEKVKNIFSKTNLEQLRNFLKENITKETLSNIYIKQSALAKISSGIYGSWDKLQTEDEDSTGDDKAISLAELQEKINGFDKEERRDIIDFFTKGNKIIRRNNKNNAIRSAKEETVNIYDEVYKYSGKALDTKEDIKIFLDNCLQVLHFVRPFYIYKMEKGKLTLMKTPSLNKKFLQQFTDIYNSLNAFVLSYNKIRNYLTKKPYSTAKMKLMFEVPTLLSGWDLNKETANACVLFRKDGKYYLGIIHKDNRSVFDIKSKKDLTKQITASGTDDYYEKMVYKQVSNIARDFAHAFCAPGNRKTYTPSERILQINKEKLYVTDENARCEWIEFLKESLNKHPEWSKVYGPFKFKPSKEYSKMQDFYDDAKKYFYKINFDTKIKSSYITQMVKEGKLFLFEIYNKDFSTFPKGAPNLHTLYFKALFDEENIKKKIFKLSGGAEVFWRPLSIKQKDIIKHPKNKSVKNKNENNSKKESLFEYDLIKDRRFTVNKYFLHFPFAINYLAAGKVKISDEVNKFIKASNNFHIIGIDRGENNLLYYTVIDLNGKIKEQKSLNHIVNEYKNTTADTDYHKLLADKEDKRRQARSQWETIENIKELKSGYLSQVVHKLSRLIIKYNALVFLENLNIGFKRGRFKVEKQVYQKFEKALIDKLNYLVFKDADNAEGSVLKGYQLTDPYSGQAKNNQNGIIFYVPAGYTSKIDAATGFINDFAAKYENISLAQKFIKDFVCVSYNKKEDFFEFNTGIWNICSTKVLRPWYDVKTKQTKDIDVNEELKSLFKENNISYTDGQDLKNKLCAVKNADFYKKFLFYFKVLVALRYKNKTDDFILSCVKSKEGEFFDSRRYKGTDILPQDADANGAYHIALKGLMKVLSIKKGETCNISNKEWNEWIREYHKGIWKI